MLVYNQELSWKSPGKYLRVVTLYKTASCGHLVGPLFGLWPHSADTDFNSTSSVSVPLSQPSGEDVHVSVLAGRILPQTGKVDRHEKLRPHRHGVRTGAQTDSTAQRTRPQSLRQRERPFKESQRLAGAGSRPLNTDSCNNERTFSSFFFCTGNKLLPHVGGEWTWASWAWTDKENTPGGGGNTEGIRRVKTELVWVASHLSVTAVHSYNLPLGGDLFKF